MQQPNMKRQRRGRRRNHGIKHSINGIFINFCFDIYPENADSYGHDDCLCILFSGDR